MDANAAVALARVPEHNFPNDGCAPPLSEFAEEISDLAPVLASLKPLGQVRESFILAVNAEGLWIIDQHVAHERVLFERVLKQRAAQKVESQRLLMPLILELTPAQQVVFAEISEELNQNGFEAEMFGTRSIAIKSPRRAWMRRRSSACSTNCWTIRPRRAEAEHGESLGADRGLHRLPRRHQDQHAARAEQDGVAAGRIGENRMSHDLPARKARSSAILIERDPEGV